MVKQGDLCHNEAIQGVVGAVVVGRAGAVLPAVVRHAAVAVKAGQVGVERIGAVEAGAERASRGMSDRASDLVIGPSESLHQ